MEPGMTRIKFKVQDGEGNWSLESYVDIFVAEHLYQVRLPMIQQ